MFLPNQSSDSLSSAHSEDFLASSPVTWHVALWTLLPLAINSMAQPAGRICGQPARYRIYLSISPIICLADALLLLVGTVFMKVYLKTPLTRAICAQTSVRRSDEGNHKTDAFGPRSLLSWPRCLIFVFGALPASITLCSFSGTPWTQVWGLMFLCSFLVIEAIYIMGTFCNYDHASPRPLPREDPVFPKILWLFKILQTCEITIFVVAILVQVSVNIWVAQTLVLPIMPFILASKTLHVIDMYILVFGTALFLAFGFLKLVLYFMGLSKTDNRFYSYTSWIFGWIWRVYLFDVFYYPRPEKEKKWFYQPMVVLMWLLSAVEIWRWILVRVCLHAPRISRALLIAPDAPRPTEKTGGEVAPVGTCAERTVQALQFFVVTFTFCVLWYAFRYDQTDTINPAWTHVFGRVPISVWCWKWVR